jgi:hypothetical protein
MLFYVFLCCSIYCLFFFFLCIVCVYMRTVVLPPGGYPIAVKYIISYRITSYHTRHPVMALSYPAFAIKFGNCKVFTLQSQAYLTCRRRREMYHHHPNDVCRAVKAACTKTASDLRQFKVYRSGAVEVCFLWLKAPRQSVIGLRAFEAT